MTVPYFPKVILKKKNEGPNGPSNFSTQYFQIKVSLKPLFLLLERMLLRVPGIVHLLMSTEQVKQAYEDQPGKYTSKQSEYLLLPS